MATETFLEFEKPIAELEGKIKDLNTLYSAAAQAAAEREMKKAGYYK